jgi:DNA-directed RNA polymerase III subunit RPC4
MKQTKSKLLSSSTRRAATIDLTQRKEPVSNQQNHRTTDWHTEEQKLEWAHKRKRMNDITNELKNTAEAESRQGHVYLVQFPSTMPPLISTAEADKMSPEERQTLVDRELDAQDSKGKGKSKGAKPKVASFVENRPSHLPPSGGHVGKLRVYKSGKTEMVWGGLPFKLKLGATPFFYQEAVLIRQNGGDAGDESGSGIGGNVYSLGEVKSKFVVVPDTIKYFSQQRTSEKD